MAIEKPEEDLRYQEKQTVAKAIDSDMDYLADVIHQPIIGAKGPLIGSTYLTFLTVFYAALFQEAL